MVQQTFRSALNGFNREDVVHYIEYLNTQHAAEVSQLQSELEFLRNNAQASSKPSDVASTELIEQQAARIRELFDTCVEYSPFMRRRITLLRLKEMIDYGN